ncbi:hypothetical protein B296_00040130 [Ensete ventricosum]|uniref:Uncharacterized protein n=1 Tax=Ensete ventricosum TaxID=4639 RepID=A0A426XTC8_ENSVE|nr:hypothetical protein B296_00040130 [Ensete ventricosum]
MQVAALHTVAGRLCPQVYGQVSCPQVLSLQVATMPVGDHPMSAGHGRLPLAGRPYHNLVARCRGLGRGRPPLQAAWPWVATSISSQPTGGYLHYESQQ